MPSHGQLWSAGQSQDPGRSGPRCSQTLLLTLSLLWAASALAVPRHVYLTWQGDPSTSVTINYHTFEKAAVSEVRYDTQSRAGQPDDYRWRTSGATHVIDGLAHERLIHVVELSALKPGGAYYFVAGDEEHGFSPERKFRTVPDAETPIRFVVGGDMGISRHAEKLMRIAAGRDPFFAAIGGDLAYGNGRLTKRVKWDRWLDSWHKSFVSPEGFMIPMVLAIGNHEVQGGYGQPPEEAPFYFGYFRQGSGEGRSFFSKRIGRRSPLRPSMKRARWSIVTQFARDRREIHRTANAAFALGFLLTETERLEKIGWWVSADVKASRFSPRRSSNP